MSRNLMIFADGTSMMGGLHLEENTTNIFKLYRATRTGADSPVVDCYETILRHYQPGDRIFLFGFSRGAYTVRNVAGVLNLCGIPDYVGQAGVTYARNGADIRRIVQETVNIYEHGTGKDRDQYTPEREERARRFRLHDGWWWQRGRTALGITEPTVIKAGTFVMLPRPLSPTTLFSGGCA